MIRGYLRHRRTVLLLFVAVCVFFPLVQALYGLSLSPTLYSLLLVTFLLAIGCAFDYTRYASRARALDAVLSNLSEAAHALPEAIGPIEERYHEMARALYALLMDQVETLGRLHGEQVDYYTMWMHQIKTPIAAMRLALSGNAPPEVIEDELFKIERYVEMALQFVKMSDMAGDLVVSEVDVHHVAAASVKKYAGLFIGKRLRVSIEPFSLHVTTDEKWLAFIIEQLLSNAVKYTQKGGVRIAMEEGVLVVEDTGIGIRPEDVQRIFQKGYTGYNGRIEQRASGLGLYMSGRVARHLGIRIQVESTLGQGPKMLLYFPRKDHFIL